jgi:phospholipid/cholesterol/gamma-HCH transport system permease protein
MKALLEHIGRIVLMVKGGLRRPENSRVYWIEFMAQCNDIGIRSLPIVLIISFWWKSMIR